MVGLLTGVLALSLYGRLSSTILSGPQVIRNKSRLAQAAVLLQ